MINHCQISMGGLLVMQAPISVHDKVSFIHWFLRNFQLKKRESVWILNYLINHKEILKHVHFVREAKFCPRAIIISSHCSDDIPFRFYKNNIVTTDPEKSFHDIRLNRDESLYIQLNFKGAYQNILYVSVLEENPFLSDEYFITENDRQMAEYVLDQALYAYKEQELQEKINHALDEKNEQEFMHLTEILCKLRKNKPHQPI